jgi:hypothetical protein
MDDAYVEMKCVPEMKGSLNAVISNQRKLYRPPSLSESFAWTAENVLRANASNTSLDLMISPTRTPQRSPEPPPKETKSQRHVCSEGKIVNYALRFLFHITLISIFESVFFFLYISKLEDNGIDRTVGTFVNDVVTSCSNFTVVERNITNDLLSLFVNPSVIIQQGNDAYNSRAIVNRNLFLRSWIYVGGLAGFFVLLTGIALLRKVKIKWAKLVLENLILVTILAAYEYTFFSTVIFPYNPITGQEILRNTVYTLQSDCGLLPM